jgi:predicted amidohydrolase
MKIMVVAGVDLKGEKAPDCIIGQVLIDDEGKILHVHHKTVLWDYEYTCKIDQLSSCSWSRVS